MRWSEGCRHVVWPPRRTTSPAQLSRTNHHLTVTSILVLFLVDTPSGPTQSGNLSFPALRPIYDHLFVSGIPPGSPQSISNILSPGIISLFVQGLETGLVLSQFAQWLSLERKEGTTTTVLVLFVTNVGLSVLSFLPNLISRVTGPLVVLRPQYVSSLRGEFTFVI